MKMNAIDIISFLMINVPFFKMVIFDQEKLKIKNILLGIFLWV